MKIFNSVLSPTFAIAVATVFLNLASLSMAEAETAQKWTTKKGGSATFLAIGWPSALRVEGTGATVEGEAEIQGNQVTGQFDVELADLDTQNGMRNRHMKEKYLETDKYPKAKLELKSVDLPKDWKPGVSVKDADFEGALTLKGVPKPVKKGMVTIEGEDMATKASFEIQLKNYPIGVPSFMGITVADDVTVEVSIPGFERK